jgi:TIR domain
MRTIFLSHIFGPQDRDLVDQVDRLVVSHGLRVATGRALGGEALTDEVKARIQKADALLALLTTPYQRSDGKWTTHDWVKSELQHAREHAKPSIALVETGVKLGGLAQGQESIPLDRQSPLEAFIRLSETIAEWKRKAGRLVRIRLQPDEVAEIASDEHTGARCRYRFVDDTGGKPSDFTEGQVIQQAGGIILFVNGADERHYVQVQVEGAGATWRSPFEPQMMHVVLKKAGAP